MFEFDLLVILVFIGHVINGLAWGERYPIEPPWLLAPTTNNRVWLISVTLHRAAQPSKR